MSLKLRSLLLAIALTAFTAPSASATGDLSCDRAERVCAQLSTAFASALGLPPDASISLRALRFPHRSGLVVSDETLLDVHIPKRGTNAAQALVAKLTVLGKGDAAPQEVWVRVDATIEVPTIVTRGALRRGTALTSADIERVLRPWAPGKLHRPEAALGRVTRRALQAGEALDPALLTLPNVVRRGQRVTAVVSGASFRIRTAAEVLEDGAIGDSIAVKVHLSGKRLQARVLGPDLVEVVQ